MDNLAIIKALKAGLTMDDINAIRGETKAQPIESALNKMRRERAELLQSFLSDCGKMFNAGLTYTAAEVFQEHEIEAPCVEGRTLRDLIDELEELADDIEDEIDDLTDDL